MLFRSAGLTNQGGCNAKQVSGEKACAWVTQEAQYECAVKAAVDCRAITDKTKCTGECKYSEDAQACAAEQTDAFQKQDLICMELAETNDVGALNKTKCESDAKCAPAKAGASYAYCTPFDKCGVISTAQQCDGVNGCEFNSAIRQCQAQFTQACVDASCCNEVAVSGEDAAKTCNTKICRTAAGPARTPPLGTPRAAFASPSPRTRTSCATLPPFTHWK